MQAECGLVTNLRVTQLTFSLHLYNTLTDTNRIHHYQEFIQNLLEYVIIKKVSFMKFRLCYFCVILLAQAYSLLETAIVTIETYYLAFQKP